MLSPIVSHLMNKWTIYIVYYDVSLILKFKYLETVKENYPVYTKYKTKRQQSVKMIKKRNTIMKRHGLNWQAAGL